jgi:hypothetical protein
MSKNDIRLRRQKLTARGPDRFRNYGAVLERHEKEMKIKKILRVFTFLFIIMIVVMMIIIVVRVERRASQKQRNTAHAMVMEQRPEWEEWNPRT